MLEFFKTLLASKEFIPHGHCYLWQLKLVGLHVLSDSLIAIAYYSIPVTLLYFVRKRQDFPFNWIFFLFATFIITCGTTHLMEIWTLWHPTYWLSGSIKAMTALVSMYTAFELVHWMPKALAFPSPAQLEAANRELEHEISERQQAEAALRQSEERWHLAVAGTNEAIWDWNILTNQTFRSERWYEMLGYECHELSSNDDEWSKPIHPDDYERVMAAQEAYLLRQMPSHNVEYRLRRKDGSYGWFRSRAKAVWDEQGHPVRLVGSLGEITDRKQVELALQEREAMLRRIGDNLPNGAIYKVIRELDGSDRFYYLSAGIEKLMEVSAEDALKDSSLLYSQFIPEDVPRLQAAVEQSMRDFSVFDVQLRIRTTSNRLKWFHFRSSPRQLVDGRIAWDGLVVDVTELKRTEETLRKNEALLEESQRVARLGNWEYDLATGKISWSKGLFELFKRDPKLSTPSYEKNLELYHPEDREKLAQAVECAISTGESYKLVLRAFRSDGVLIYVEGIGYAEFNPTGEVIRLYGTAQDISEQQAVLRDLKLTEAALRESETRFQAFMDNSPALAWITDATGHLIYFSQTFQRTFDLLPDQVFGKSVFDVFPMELAQQYFDNNQTVIQTNQVLETVEIAPRTDGTLSKFLVCKFPIPGISAQKLVGGVAIDITERQHAEQMMELQAIITRNIAEGICLVRADDGIIVYANPKFEQMFGYDSDELRGLHVSIVNYADDHITAEEVNQVIRAAVLKNGEAAYEVHNVKKDGTPFWCSATTSVFEHPEYGKVLVAVQQDITEHKQAEEQIKASLKEKEVLLKEIHHRVKNNLGIVSSLLQMQCRRTQNSQATAILRDSQNRIASIALVHEKLYRSADLANIDFAQYIPDLTTHLFDSYNVSSNCIKLNIQVDDASLDIETAIPCGLIINELVSNALKYAFPDHRTGEIQVKLSQQNRYNLILIIRDNGIGLPADFDNKKVKTLGITLVQGLVKQLRGSIEINSQQGTEFKIKFTKSRT